MFTSVKYSFLALKLGLAIVFLWFGMDKFFHMQYWINAWTLPRLVALLKPIGLVTSQLIYPFAVFEILVGLSLITGVFTKFFSALAIIFLAGTIYFFGMGEASIRSIGLLGGFAAVALWPYNRTRF